ncbi:MAG: PRD domain-containing protein [Faecalibacterium sp.]|jgi:beta-glucoside operon transcriptional antiterminator|nr:PRD domain-containing protein [Faecalibacterium sp.]
MNTIVKVYNNNTVAAKTDDGKECVLTGSGIGFSKKPGDPIALDKIEKTFYIQSALQQKYLRLLEQSDPRAREAAEEIVQRAAQQLGVDPGPLAFITLSDHLTFALERHRKGIELPNLLADEVKLLYPEQYQLGLWGLKQFEQKTGVQLSTDEASYIAMHLVDSGAQDSKAIITRTLQFVKDVLAIICADYDIHPATGSSALLRLSTHLKCLGSDICRGTSRQPEIKEEADAAEELAFLLKKHPASPQCIRHITEYIRKEYDYSLQNSETVYLLIYINRMI